MKRREFVKKAGIAGVGATFAPSILSKENLLAATKNKKVEHVVFCLLGGGLRNLETVHQINGNLMPSVLLENNLSNASQQSEFTIKSKINSLPLQSSATLFKEFRFKKERSRHINGYATALTGSYYDEEVKLTDKNFQPTIFEYYNKYGNVKKSGLNSWWVSSGIADYHELAFSKSSDFGENYAGNFIQPSKLISSVKKNNRSLSSESIEFEKHYNQSVYSSTLLKKNHKEQTKVNHFLRDYLFDYQNIEYTNSLTEHDLHTTLFSKKVMQEFAPELLVIDLQGADIAHSNYTQYCNAIQRYDFMLGYLWKTIQNTPGMANNTLLIVTPEFGRDYTSNSITDINNKGGVNHGNDETSQEIFCLLAGPKHIIKQEQVIIAQAGESIDIAPTIAYALGFYDAIPLPLKQTMGSVLSQAFV